MKGFIIQSLVFELFIVLLLSSLIISLIHKLSQETLYSINHQKVENNISKSISTLYSASKPRTNVWGMPLYKWYYNLDSAPTYLKDRIEALKNNNRIKSDTIILESINSYPVYFYKDNSQADKFYGKLEPKFLSVINNDRWIIYTENGVRRVIKRPLRHFDSINNFWNISFQNFESNLPILDYITNHNNDFVQNETSFYAQAIEDHFIIYVNLLSELRRLSLITMDNQPVAENIQYIKYDNDKCIIEGIHKGVRVFESFPCKNHIHEPYLFYDFLSL